MAKLKFRFKDHSAKVAERYKKQMYRRLDKAANALAKEFKRELSTKATAPVGAPPGTRTGELKDSISVKEYDKETRGIGSYGTSVGFYQEFGVSAARPGYPMKIHLRNDELPKDEKIYYDDEGPYIYRMSRRPVGPRPWLRPTWERMKQKVREILTAPRLK